MNFGHVYYCYIDDNRNHHHPPNPWGLDCFVHGLSRELEIKEEMRILSLTSKLELEIGLCLCLH